MMGGLLTLSVSLSRTGQQVVSCQWNSPDTVQETYIVLYKLFPPNKGRKDWTSLERARGGGSNLLRQIAPNGEKVACKKTN